VIDAIEDLPGLFLASGFSGHGFGLAPAAGQLIAEMVAGEALTVDPVPFAFSRFFPSKRGNGPSPRFNEKQNN
jgi:glycine/D-amino acid oxidase-like deaminating enzyme